MEKVTMLYNELVNKGYSKKDAAKEAQARTGVSAVTGKPIRRTVAFTNKGKVKYGQYSS